MLSLFHSKHAVILLAATITVLLITLFFGLRPRRGSDFSNQVQWLQETPGMHFQRYSLIYANLDKNLVRNHFSGNRGFSIEIAIQPEKFDKHGFQLILTLHDGTDQDQFLLGQWGSSLVIMNGDDYDHKKNAQRITHKITPDPSKKLFLSLTTGPEGSNLYVDGKLVHSDSHLTVQFPSVSQSRLTVGNSVYGKHPWKGYVYGLGLYGYELAPASIEAHYKSWAESKNFEFIKKDHPSLLYLFNEKKGDKAINHLNGESPLLVPSKFHVLKKIILSPPMPYSASTKTLISDVTINFIGFIPLGFFLVAFLLQWGRSKKQAIIQTVILCSCLSLGIEIVQAWEPSRSSQSLDVILNTLGGMAGALIHKYINFPTVLIAP